MLHRRWFFVLVGLIAWTLSQVRAAEPTTVPATQPVVAANADFAKLFSGETFRGQCAVQSIKLTGLFGAVEISVDNVATLNALNSRGDIKLKTRDNDVLVGRAQARTIPLVTATGQTVDVPVNQLAEFRPGARARAAVAPPATAASTQPATAPAPVLHMLVTTTAGDAVTCDRPASDFSVRTRYGLISLHPDQIADVQFQSSATAGSTGAGAAVWGVPIIHLMDDSVLAGLFPNQTMELNPTSLGSGPASILVGNLASLKLADAAKPDSAQVKLAGGDVLNGALASAMTIQTEIGDATIPAAEVAQITPAEDSPGDFLVKRGDGTVARGLPANGTADVALACGITLKVPTASILSYIQPRPQLPQAVLDTIGRLAKDLESPDAATRDAAEARLTAIGPTIAANLREIRHSLKPDAQARIDQVLKNYATGSTGSN
jgi:hypothetical protein